MEELWAEPSPAAADAIRTVCQRLLVDAEAFTDSFLEPARSAQNESALLSDASLMEEDRHLNRSELVQWLTAHIQHPGQRVAPYVGPRTTEYVKDLAARGIRPDFAQGWRAALAVAWRRWVQECVSLGLAPDVLVEVIDVSAHSLMQYTLDSIEALREANLAATTGSAQAEAVAMIQLIASGAPVAQDLAEGRLNYRLSRQHLGLVLWSAKPEGNELDDAAAALRSLVEPRCSLVARGSTTSRWLWLSGAGIPDVHQLERAAAGFGSVSIALGRTGSGLEGFSGSHQDALSAQSVIVRLGSDRRFTPYDAVELVDALTKDRASARRFVVKTLGPLVDAEEVLREALLAYVQSGFNTTQTAAALYAHRNTVERRVSRANELSAVKIEENPTHVAAALMVLGLAPQVVAPD
ncbi:MAG: PucR family transcriptional regulator [Actinomycetales bacterium]